MIDVLENKVSELIAENGTLKLTSIQFEKDNHDYIRDISIFKQQIAKLSIELEKSAKENHHIASTLQK